MNSLKQRLGEHPLPRSADAYSEHLTWALPVVSAHRLILFCNRFSVLHDYIADALPQSFGNADAKD